MGDRRCESVKLCLCSRHTGGGYFSLVHTNFLTDKSRQCIGRAEVSFGMDEIKNARRF